MHLARPVAVRGARGVVEVEMGGSQTDIGVQKFYHVSNSHMKNIIGAGIQGGGWRGCGRGMFGHSLKLECADSLKCKILPDVGY